MLARGRAPPASSSEQAPVMQAHTHMRGPLSRPPRPRGSCSSALRGPGAAAWTREPAEGAAAMAGSRSARLGGVKRSPPCRGTRGPAAGAAASPQAACGCPVVPALSPGLSALLSFYSEHPARKAGVWLLQSSSGPQPTPPDAGGSPSDQGTHSAPPSPPSITDIPPWRSPSQPQLGRAAGTAHFRAGGEWAGRSGAAGSQLHQTDTSE